MKSYRSTCGRDTNQEVVHEEEETATPTTHPEMEIDFWEAKHQIVRCKGCDEYGFRRVVVCSEDVDPRTGHPEIQVQAYPSRPASESPSPRHPNNWQIRPLPNTPRVARRIYAETVSAYNAGFVTLATAGLRATVEAICLDKKVKSGQVQYTKPDGSTATKRSSNLDGKIAGLAEKAHLTKAHADVLNEHRFMGNAAVHQLSAPTDSDIEVALDIIEHTLDNLYELSHKKDLLSKSRAAKKTK